MANQIKAPYNFVPINHEVYIPLGVSKLVWMCPSVMAKMD